MNIETTALDGVLLITPPTMFEDFRGEYVEIYNRDLYMRAGIDQNFIQDDISVSSRHVLRGIHGDAKTWKLVSCLHGSFYLVVVNWDETSPQFRKWTAFTLSEKNRRQVLIPPKHGNGHLVLSESAIFHYKQTTEYDRAGQFTVLWNDPDLNIYWPVKTPILSTRDAGV
ncbi:dTDP-4-dehydrorhamnose 3,5-epimerase [uncultured Alphaproteobacteria bacterium]|uniref:dTDP-4-dehydrorhamnose 3,5-epimerase n=1 Tax=uncultured Alphaproteobacteria bacterium TaxID=91750 RepID=A0A212JQ54_9PROT|nr:dTDP-4-dehydrorhamnose 3,5-epimerase [uncultured Alphaproteobacteria bacterium]